MTSRQVRLADDVASFVEQRQAADGGSLSAAANRILREHLSREAYESQHEKAAKAEVAVIGPPSRKRPAQRLARATKAESNGRCPHPILRRIGDNCAACGATVG